MGRTRTIGIEKALDSPCSCGILAMALLSNAVRSAAISDSYFSTLFVGCRRLSGELAFPRVNFR